MKTLNNNKIKPVDVVELTFSVPQEQVNTLKQLAFRYILENNNEEVALKLLNLSQARLRNDLTLYTKPSAN